MTVPALTHGASSIEMVTIDPVHLQDGKKPQHKVRYLLSVLAATPSGQDPRRKLLIQAVLDDCSRLSREM